MGRAKRYVPGIFRHPVGVGLAVVAILAIVILVLGTDLAQKDLLRSVEDQQIEQTAHLSQTLHYSAFIPADRDAVREAFAKSTGAPGFDTFMRRSIFGLDIARLDVFALDGERLYTTDPASSASVDPDTFTAARRGAPMSELKRGAVFAGVDGSTRPRDVLATYSLIEDAPPDDARGGRPLAVLALYSDVGDSLSSLRAAIWWIVGVFSGGLTIIFVIIYLVSEATRRRLEAANEALQEQYAAVRESRERMLAADEAAKRAIAEELHGSVQSKLYAVWMKLGAISAGVRTAAPEKADDLDRIVDEVDAIREEDIRKLSHRLHPGIIRVGALAGLRSLRDYYEQFVPIELTIGEAAQALESGGVSQIPERIRLAVYRSAELAFGNVVKHARATQAFVRWDYDEEAGELRLSVADNGVGFDQKPYASSGIGLVTIADYADVLGGRFQVRSKPGEGTRLEVMFPFAPEPRQEGAPQPFRSVRQNGRRPAEGAPTRGAVAGVASRGAHHPLAREHGGG